MRHYLREEIEKLRIDNRTLRNFGLLLCSFLAVISVYTLWHGSQYWKWILPVCAISLLLTVIWPNSLRRFYKLWMTLAFILGWVMTRLLLTVTFFVILTPFALLLRISGKDMLSRKIEKNRDTYWIKHEAITDMNRYKKQF